MLVTGKIQDIIVQSSRLPADRSRLTTGSEDILNFS